MSFRGLLIPLLLLGVAFAGCLNPSEIEGATTLPDPTSLDARSIVHAASGAALDATALVTTAVGRVTDVGHIAIEPTIAAAPDGTLFYAAAQFENPQVGNMPYTDIMRSQDGGLTWEVVTAKLPNGMNSPPLTGDPYVHVDMDTGRVFSLDMYQLACSWMAFSDNLGDSWTYNPVACGMPPGVHDHQTMATGKPRVLSPVGYENNVYYCVNRVADSACAVSLDGGLTFGPLRPLVFQGYDPLRADPAAGMEGAFAGLCGGLHGHVATTPEGIVMLPKEHCGDPAVAISDDDGLTWRISVVNETVGAFGGPDPSVAADEAGNMYYFWVDAMGYTRLAVSQDAGMTWGPAHNVTAPGVTATGFPSIAAGGAGKVAFVYVGTDHAGGYETNTATDDWETAIWTGYLGVITDALAADPVIVTSATNTKEDPLVRGRCGDVRCPGIFDFIDVTIDNEGRPWGAFVDACREKCATPEGTPEDNKYSDAPGIVMTLASGPALRGELAELPALPVAAVEPADSS